MCRKYLYENVQFVQLYETKTEIGCDNSILDNRLIDKKIFGFFWYPSLGDTL
jgi:hypothetical protein